MQYKQKISIIGLSGQSVFLNVDHFHHRGETITASTLHTEPGGKGYNQAAAILALGGEVSYLSAIGDDLYGEECINALKGDKSNLFFKKVKDGKTAFATILTNAQGENQVTVYRGVSNDLTVSDVEAFKEEIITSKILLLTLELPLAVITAAIKIAKENYVLVIMNPAPWNNKFTQISLCDYLTPNEIEARQIYGLSEDEDILKVIPKIISEKHKNVIITLGSKGCLLVSNGSYEMIPAQEVKAIDTTGAGDVFNATLAWALANNKTLREAVTLANLVAAKSTTYPYVLKNINQLKEVINKVNNTN